MKHYMRLHPKPFEQIISKKKTVEARLNDKKRAIIQAGDEIVFLKRPDEKESVTVEVTGKKLFNSFAHMGKEYDLELLGFDKDATKNECEDCYRKYYTEYDERDYGVVTIEFAIKK